MVAGLEFVGGIERWIPVVVVSVLVLPLGGLVTWLLARRRVQAGQPPNTAWPRTVAEVGIVVGTLPWLWMILTPVPNPPEFKPIPLLDIWQMLQQPPLTAFYQIVGNLLVFAAFGFLAPLRWSLTPARIMGIAALGSATVELLQWVLPLGRVASVDDILLNAVGAGLAALASRAVVGRFWSANSALSSVP